MQTSKNVIRDYFEKNPKRSAVIAVCAVLVIMLFARAFSGTPAKTAGTTTAAGVSSPFVYSFNVPGTLFEAPMMEKSTSPYWWVNSGAVLTIGNGIGETMQGDMSPLSPWHALYAKNNPTDTDLGAHPQNIFRLITRSTWQDFRQEAYFRITALNMSRSPNRNESNGLLLFERYADSANLYYAGVRVDGTAVIKKKIHGTYFTLAQKKIFPGAAYDRIVNPNLLPLGKWIGLRVETKNGNDGRVIIRLLTDIGRTGMWSPALQAVDDGESYGGKAIVSGQFAGIRTDFMDVQFSSYRLENLQGG